MVVVRYEVQQLVEDVGSTSILIQEMAYLVLSSTKSHDKKVVVIWWCSSGV